MSNKTPADELWQGIYKSMAGAIHLMVLSSASADEARRRIGVIRLELAVAEGGIGVLHQAAQSSHRVTVHDDADASEGTCLAEVESLPPSESTVAERTCNACGFKMLAAGWLKCPSCGTPRGRKA